MVIFKDVTISKKAYLVILGDESQSIEKGIHLRVHPPLIGSFAPTWPALVSSFPHVSWTSETGPTKSWTLQSPHHGSAKNVPTLPTLGQRIVSGEVNWSDNLEFVGEFRYLKGYWEWSEDILSRCVNELRGANIYDAVYASLFTYDKINDIMKAFCEAWCPSTNTLLTSAGELSISLWDLQDLAGLPTLGELYDEVIPSKKELLGASHDGKAYLPKSCKYLFHAYHIIHDEGGDDKSNSVLLEEWIKFWSKITSKYQEPPPRKEKKSRSKKTYNPAGDIKGHKIWTSANSGPFIKLDIKEDHWTETYLAAYLACWLCSFVLPEGDARRIRPETFKMASMIATQQKVSLALPVLTSIYRGLNIISRSSKPSLAQSTFPAHFVYGWLAHYFETHYRSGLETSIPKMIKFSGEKGARYYTSTQARRKIHKWEQIPWHCTMLTKNKDISYVNDDDVVNFNHRSLFIAIRSLYLARRSGDCFIIEPYSPHRFSRQFGYYQTRPGSLIKDVREASLEDGLRYWRDCLLRKSMSRVCFPSVPSNAKKFVSVDYTNWWDRVYRNFLDFSYPDLIQFVTRKDKKQRVDIDQQPPPVVSSHPKSDDALQDQEKHAEVDSPKGKRKGLSLDDSVSSNRERHWKRPKKQQEEKSKSAENLAANVSHDEDALVHEVGDGSKDHEDSLESQGSIDRPQLVEIQNAKGQNDFKCVPPVGAISEFNSEALFDNHFKLFFQKYWGELRSRILRTPISFMSSIKDDVSKGISRLKVLGYDISKLEHSLEDLFVKAVAYDDVRSISVETGEDFAQRLEEKKAHLADMEAKADKEETEIASLSASIKSRRFALMKKRNMIGHLKEEIDGLKESSSDAARIKDELTKSALLLETAQKAFEDQDPLA